MTDKQRQYLLGFAKNPFVTGTQRGRKYPVLVGKYGVYDDDMRTWVVVPFGTVGFALADLADVPEELRLQEDPGLTKRYKTLIDGYYEDMEMGELEYVGVIHQGKQQYVKCLNRSANSGNGGYTYIYRPAWDRFKKTGVWAFQSSDVLSPVWFVEKTGTLLGCMCPTGFKQVSKD